MKKFVTKIKSVFFAILDFVWQKGDPVLLAFLILVMNYRYSLKLAAITMILILRPYIKIKKDGVFFFFVGMCILAILNFIVRGNYNSVLLINTLAGCLFWLAGCFVFLQVRHTIELNDTQKTINTLKILTLVNFLASIFDFIKVVAATHTINPFTQNVSPPYGISSGDLIGGVFGQMHLVNTIACSLLLVFFIYQKDFFYTLLCLVPILLTGSNLGNIILACILLYVIFFKKGSLYKSLSICCLIIMSLYYMRVTPNNQSYSLGVFHKLITPPSKNIVGTAKVDVTTNSTKIDDDLLISLYLDYLTKKKNLKKDTTVTRNFTKTTAKIEQLKHVKKLEKYKETDLLFFRKDSVAKNKLNNPFFDYGRLKKFDLEKEPGKITSLKQTFTYLSKSPLNLLLGAGAGQFSSRQAFITSGIISDSKILMSLPKQESIEFKENHKALFKYLMFRDDATHSITNLPFCWYNQLFGEYGLLGAMFFFLLYCGYFLVRIKHLSFGKILFPAMLFFFMFDYWHERLCITILFELLMLLDIKLNQEKETAKLL